MQYLYDKWKAHDDDNDKQKCVKKTIPLVLCDHLIPLLSPYKKSYGIYHMEVQSTIQAF